MIKNNIKETTIKQIIKLKRDLMPRTKSFRSGKSGSSIFSMEFNKIINCEVGEIFEKNIRETLIFEYNFKEGNIKRHFFFRTLAFDKKEEILLIGEQKTVIINNMSYIFKLNGDQTVTILEESGQIFQIISSNKLTHLPIEKENVEIGKFTEIEFDGSFLFNHLAFEKFNKDEVITLIKNVSNSEFNSFNYVIIEIKLNKNKISDLIDQLLRDKNILEKIYKNKKFLYVGFINSKELDIDISYKIKELNIIVYGLKNNIFASRDMRKFYDWNTIKNLKLVSDEITEIKSEVNKLNGEVTKLNGEVTKLNGEVTEIKNKIDIIGSQILKIFDLLGKKRKREEIDDKTNDEDNDNCK